MRVQVTAVAVAGLAAAGHEREVSALLRGLPEAAEHFGHRLPEMFAGEQRTAGKAPLPHSAACRPAVTVAASAVLVLPHSSGVRPDVPVRSVMLGAISVTLGAMRSAPLGETGLTGLRVAGAPFAVRVSGLESPSSRRRRTVCDWEPDLERHEGP